MITQNECQVCNIIKFSLCNIVHTLFDLDRRDSSGLRFYLGNELRQYDLGYLTLGASVSNRAIAIPPTADRFILDSYCPTEATKVNRSSTVNRSFFHPHYRNFRNQC